MNLNFLVQAHLLGPKLSSVPENLIVGFTLLLEPQRVKEILSKLQ